MADYPVLATRFSTYSRNPKRYQTIRTEMESGAVQTRAKNTDGVRVFDIEHFGLSSADVATWEAFYVARKGGAESFNFTIPGTATVVVVRFISVPSIEPLGVSTFNISEVILEEAL